VLNLFDLTGGNYRLQRTIFYPEFPLSQIVTDAQVTAVSDEGKDKKDKDDPEDIESTHRKPSEWVTNITINGTYDGPTDIVSTEDYQLVWTACCGDKIIEFGTSTLRLSSGRSVRQHWLSTIIPEEGFEGFPESGELLRVSISPFQIEGKEMRYEWRGTVERLPKQQKNDKDKKDKDREDK
jgi:hypothetical protein